MTDKFALLAGIASDWWWETNADLRLTFLSERFTEVFGLRASDFVGKPPTDIPRSDYTAWNAHLDRMRQRLPFRDFETTIVDAAGVSRPITLSGTPVFDGDGTFTGHIGIGRDLTELRANERHLESIMENIEQGVLLLDAGFNVVAYNKRLVDFLEFDPVRDGRGLSYAGLVRELAARGEYDPEPAEEAIRRRVEAIRTPTKTTIERKRADGRTFSATFAPLPGGGGVMTYSDVSEARQREARLAESEERFRQLFAHSPLAKWVYSKDTLDFLEVNEAAVATYGYSREEFLQMNLEDIRPPEDVDRLREWIAESGSQRDRATGFRHRCKNGQLIDVDVFLRDIQFDGTPARMAAVLDITARMKAERRVQSIFETSREVILVADSYGTLLQVSPRTRETLGYAPEEMIGHSTREFILPEDLDPTRDEMRATRTGKLTAHFPCRFRHKDGTTVPLVWSAAWSEQDHWYVFMGRDMSDYERSQAQLRQAQKMEAVGQLTGGVAHDFNNILMVILARAESLEEEAALPPALLDDVKAIRGATERAASLTRQLLAFSRKQPLRPEATDINKLVAATSKLLQRTLGGNVQLDTVLGGALADVEVDRGQLEAALVNLCINARDAMPEGGHLLIETANTALDADYVVNFPDVAAGPYVMLAVSDTGSGMPPEVLDKVFEPFFTTKPTGKGTGLGLSMVYGFVKQSRGHIRLYSEVGQGTTVKIFLPKAGEARTAPTAQDVAITPRGTERVLIVEDDPAVMSSVVRQVKSLGYDVTAAANAERGLAELIKAPEPFDLLLTDVVMPGVMNGPALAADAVRYFPKIKVVFMSGYTDNAITQQGRLEPGVLLLSKPFRKQELAWMLRTALERP